MSNLFDEGDLLDVSEVSGGVSSQLTTAIVYKPWHKPRKQFVRDKQWWYHLERLLTRSPGYQNVAVIKYFGLPGSDLLDVNFLSKKLSVAFVEKKLFVHGFIDNTAEKEQADLRLSELLDRDNVDRQSKVDKYNFNALATNGSLAIEKLKEQGAYHLINLDFCDGIFKQVTFQSMMALFNVQFAYMLDIPWLFCMTTRTDEAGVAKDLLLDLNRVFQESVSSDAEFLSALEEHKQAIFNLIKNKKSIADGQLAGADLSEVLQACFLYWVVCNAHQNGARMDVVSLMKYKVHGGSAYPDMYSYVVKFTKKFVVKPDLLGIVKANHSRESGVITADDVRADKVGAVKKLSKSLDIDAFLSSDPASYDLYASEMKSLLAECGWDISDYDESVRI
ncbi:hypothetical protein Pav013_3521 [Pseudomonas syringae pv. avellanae str. ISPaVe013]|uniref:PP_RS20740 family protein n=1 Tax=Pseudomonas syringae TaxID=317 RepID=UPI00028D8BE6|nr:hypothetical protein [Pseudomonas syringae]EKG36690.1 hypothetical protein Pav013_3521 [Pseudomonas syringae pv. avellanae str. ISPaVe013]